MHLERQREKTDDGDSNLRIQFRCRVCGNLVTVQRDNLPL